MQDDPFYIVKREVELSLSQVLSLLQQRGGAASNDLPTDIKDRLQLIIADLDELDDTIKIVQTNPNKFRLERSEIESRKAFVASTRKQVAEIQRSKGKTAAVKSNSTKKPESSNNQQAIESEQQHQQILMDGQDNAVEQVVQTVRNLREIGEVMGNELDEQGRLLEDVGAHVDETQGRMDDGMKRMKDFIRDNSDIKQQVCIIFLVVIMVVLLVVVIVF